MYGGLPRYDTLRIMKKITNYVIGSSGYNRNGFVESFNPKSLNLLKLSTQICLKLTSMGIALFF